MVLRQVLDTLNPRDAVGNFALALERKARENGVSVVTYAEHIHPSLKGQARSIGGARWDSSDTILYHFGLGSPVTERVIQQVDSGANLVVYYYDLTPPGFFRWDDPALSRRLTDGEAQLRQLAGVSRVGITMSEYSRRDLVAAGFRETRVVPPMVFDDRWQMPPDPEVVRAFDDGTSNLLFVGRFVPNKRQEDVIKVFYYYRQIDPSSRLLLVGSRGSTGSYYRWLRDLVRILDLAEVHFIDSASDTAVNACYTVADAYISMSEHEGFGLPLVESMLFDVPVVAYQAAAVPETLGGAGLLVGRKDYPAIAELVHLLVRDEELRGRVIAGQQRRVAELRAAASDGDLWRAMEPYLMPLEAAPTGLQVRRATFAEALALNADHYRRMTEERRDREASGEGSLFRERDEQSYRNILRRIPSGGRALELGAADGAAFPLLLSHFDSVQGVDFFEPVVQRGREQGYAIHLGSVEDLSRFPDETFDAVVSRHTMEHTFDLASTLAEVYRVLKTGGYVGAITPHYFPDPEPSHLCKLDRHQWTEVYQSFGFEVVCSEEFSANALECHIVAYKP